MSGNTTETPQRLRDRLAGHHLLVTGATGFLAKAFLEKLLRSVDTVGSIHLLIRPRPDRASADDRLWRDVLRSHAFDRLRAALGERFTRLCEQKVRVVSGDLSKDRFGLDDDAYEALTKRITLVVNSAATVTFDERIDDAIALNTLGPGRLLRFARDCGNIPFLHVSTCYVCGARSGTIVEDFSAPEVARESLPRLPDTGAFDLDGLIASMRTEADQLCGRLGSNTEACRRELIDAGMRRARTYGWNDTYTFTKWIGEQLLVRDRGDVPLVVFRPAIIESSFEEPMPGWIDGLRMADPLIVAIGRGKLNAFPGRPEIAIDLIPVDFVANAMIATLPVGAGAGKGIAVYQCGSSERHPLTVGELMRALVRAFDKRPMSGDDGRPAQRKRLHLVDRDTFIQQLRSKQRAVSRYKKWLDRFGLAERRIRKLTAIARQIEQVIYFAKIYSPYTHLDCRFCDDALRSVGERLHADDQLEFPFDAAAIDWTDYIVDRHVPGVRSFVLGSSSEPAPRILALDVRDTDAATSRGDVSASHDIYHAFQRTAEQFPGKAALQVQRNGRWLCYSYDQAARAAGTIMRRLVERGLVPGDRIAIYAENGPEWGLCYLAAMRAGLTAVPLDPQLPAEDAWSAIRYAQAKLVASGCGLVESLNDARAEGDPDVVTLESPWIPPPAASRDVAPEAIEVDASAVASILFTSGTTVAPKAVPLTHANLLANATALMEVHDPHASDEFLSVLPMYHAFEFTGGFLVPMLCGATVTYVADMKGSEIRRAMQETGTTVMLVVPRLLRMFHDSIEAGVRSAGPLHRGAFRGLGTLSEWTGRRFGSKLFATVHEQFGGRLRMFVSGGAGLDPELFHAFDRLGFTVYEGYGLTETSPVLTVHRAGDARAASAGLPLPNVEMEIRNPNVEGVGEIWVRGPSVVSGYLDNPEATREVMIDGWFRTGDLGRRDDEGHLYLAGRSKDLIVTGAGKNVYPDEVEARYGELPFTKELCVFGLPSGVGLGDVVHAVVVLDEESSRDLDRSSIEREVREAASAIGDSIPNHQRIAVLHFWNRRLPKTSTLKSKRAAIREMVRQEGASADGAVKAGVKSARAESGDPAAPKDGNHEAWGAIRKILADQTKRSENGIRQDAHLLLDLGIDSIGKIDVLASVETAFDMRIDDEAAARIARASDLLGLVGDREPSGGGGRRMDTWRRFVGGERNGGVDNGRLAPPLVAVRWLARGTVNVLLNTYVRVRARGREHIPDRGAFILAGNHCSHLDAPSVIAALAGRRRVWVAGAEDYFFNNALKRLVFGRLFDTIPFDRHADGIAGLRRCGEALSRGDGLLLFPEGTRSTTGYMREFKVGVAVLAIEHNVPIVPVYIDRTYALMRKGARFVRPGSVTVSFGEAILPPDREATADHYAAFGTLTARVREAVDALGGGDD